MPSMNANSMPPWYLAISQTNKQQQQFYVHYYYYVLAGTPSNWSICLEQGFTAHVLLLIATTAFRLGRCWREMQKIWKSHRIPITTKIRLMKALVWPIAMYGCESWTLRKNEETRLDAFEMKGLRKILRVNFCGQQIKQMSGFLTQLG